MAYRESIGHVTDHVMWPNTIRAQYIEKKAGDAI